jgi:hypothetical protein
MDTTAKARLLAVEVLLAEPELLGNDALEGDLYLLREKLMVLDAHGGQRRNTLLGIGLGGYPAGRRESDSGRAGG